MVANACCTRRIASLSIGVAREFFMRIIKKINNNVALARDDHGREAIVFGPGVGFPKTPYELTDMSKIRRMFRDVDHGLLAAVASISDDVLSAALDISDVAAAALRCDLNSNLPFTLGDHLQFAIERCKNDALLESPLALDVAYVYPRETDVARRGLDIMERHTGIRLPESEVSSIALHLVNAETSGAYDPQNMALIMKSAAAIEKTTNIIEGDLAIKIDRESYGYVRFVTHLRYLIKRLSAAEQIDSGNADVFEHLAESFPGAFQCAKHVSSYLAEVCERACSDEEIVYLMMYLNRLQSDSRR